jgi:hypothetical protein
VRKDPVPRCASEKNHESRPMTQLGPNAPGPTTLNSLTKEPPLMPAGIATVATNFFTFQHQAFHQQRNSGRTRNEAPPPPLCTCFTFWSVTCSNLTSQPRGVPALGSKMTTLGLPAQAMPLTQTSKDAQPCRMHTQTSKGSQPCRMHTRTSKGSEPCRMHTEACAERLVQPHRHIYVASTQAVYTPPRATPRENQPWSPSPRLETLPPGLRTLDRCTPEQVDLSCHATPEGETASFPEGMSAIVTSRNATKCSSLLTEDSWGLQTANLGAHARAQSATWQTHRPLQASKDMSGISHAGCGFETPFHEHGWAKKHGLEHASSLIWLGLSRSLEPFGEQDCVT